MAPCRKARSGREHCRFARRDCRRSARARQAWPRAGSCGVGRLAPAALRCSHRGRVAELAALTAFAALKHRRRAGLRSARVRAPTPALRCSATPKSPPRGHACRAEPMVACEQAACHGWFSKGRAGRPRRAYEAARSRRACGPRAYSRASSSCSRRVSERSELARAVSSAAGPQDRAPQRSRRQPTASSKRRGRPARPLPLRPPQDQPARAASSNARSSWLIQCDLAPASAKLASKLLRASV